MNLRLVWCAVVIVVSSGCPKPCQANAECDDGLFCNGPEQCVANTCAQGTPTACDDGIACTTDVCVEARRECQFNVPDVDDDGHGAATCVDRRGARLGDDCDDTNARRFPGALEVCDRTEEDEDCDVLTLGDIDSDRDGYIDDRCANRLPDGGANRGTDCDDRKEAVHPGQAELCNFYDDNCNGTVDEGVANVRFKDDDHDGWGAGAGVLGCVTPGTSDVGTDCDDTNPAMNPGQFKCVGTSGQYDLCTVDGGFVRGTCVQSQCRPQPNGLALCF
jgi:hypothetical protein